MRLAGVPMKEIMQELNIKNTWTCRLGLDSIELGIYIRTACRKAIHLRKWSGGLLPNQRLQAENRYLRQPNEVLKEYNELERKLKAKLQPNL